jgi:ankyrin repeat protein
MEELSPAQIKDIIDTPNNKGNTALHYAVANNNTEIVKSFLAKKADVNPPNKEGKTPLFYAVNNKNTYMVKLLLDHNAHTNVPNENGNTPLICAIFKDDITLVKLLLDQKADVNAKAGRTTHLIEAIKRYNLDIMNFLINNKANINTQDAEGLTPCHHAINIYCSLVNKELGKAIIETLLRAKPNLALQSNTEDTPLSLATQKDSLTIVRLLLGENQEETIVPLDLDKMSLFSPSPEASDEDKI